MCSSGLIRTTVNILYNFSFKGNGKLRKQMSKQEKMKLKLTAAMVDPIELEDGTHTSSLQIENDCKKIILQMLLELLQKRRYDFTVNVEVPFIDPFKYYPEFDLDVLAANVDVFEDIETIQMALSIIEYLVIITQSNYQKQYFLPLQKDQLEDQERPRITSNQRFDIIEQTLDFITNVSKELGFKPKDKTQAISILCALSVKIMPVKKF